MSQPALLRCATVEFCKCRSLHAEVYHIAVVKVGRLVISLPRSGGISVLTGDDEKCV